MFSYIWHTLFFDPIYNLLIFLINFIPDGNVGFAIIFTVILVKMLLLPVALKSSSTQLQLKKIESELRSIKEKYKNDKQAQSQAIISLYKENNINPFSSVLVVFLQIPFVIALYLSVNKISTSLSNIDTSFIYNFNTIPHTLTTNFLGFEISDKSLFLSILVGVVQFLYMNKVMRKSTNNSNEASKKTPSLKDEFAKNMQFQFRYLMPIMIAVFSYITSTAISLYFLVSGLMSFLQEWIVSRYKNKVGSGVE